MEKEEMSAKKFRHIRETVLGLTRTEFGNIFGFTYRQVRNLEEGDSRITKKNAMLMQLAALAVKHELIEFK